MVKKFLLNNVSGAMMKKKYEKPSISVYELGKKNLMLLTSNPSFPDFDPDPDPNNPYPFPIG
jgi:hypothetical protein